MSNEAIRKSDLETDARVSVLETQVDTIKMSMTRLEDKLDSNYTTLHHRISDLRDDLREDIDTKHEKLVAKLDDRSSASDEQHKDIYKKISDMEKWRWMLTGGSVVVGYVLAHIKLDRLL